MAGKLPFDPLQFDIAYALWRAKLKLSEDERYFVARRIIEHLKLCNWRIEKGPMSDAHGPAMPMKRDDVAE